MKKYRFKTKQCSVFPKKKPFKLTEFVMDELLLPLFASKDGDVDDDWLEREVEGYQTTGVVDKKWQELDEILGEILSETPRKQQD